MIPESILYLKVYFSDFSLESSAVHVYGECVPFCMYMCVNPHLQSFGLNHHSSILTIHLSSKAVSPHAPSG